MAISHMTTVQFEALQLCTLILFYVLLLVCLFQSLDLASTIISHRKSAVLNMGKWDTVENVRVVWLTQPASTNYDSISMRAC